MFDEDVIKDIKDDALRLFPNESCGVVVSGKYIACSNIADDPLNDFKINTKIISKYITAGTLEAVVHSHPHENFRESSCPSKNDMAGQISSGVPWGIVDTDGIVAGKPFWWGDFILDEPILGIEFQPGINDCYSIIRKWYWQKRNVKLPDFARNDEWWEDGEDMYVENFEKANFYKISLDEIQNGDVVLGRVRSSKINHASIYLNNPEDGYGTLLHHLPKRLSRRETANPWLGKVELCLRYKEDVEKS